MSHANVTPYGAFELKATYQRNLLLGNLTVLLLVVALVGTTWVLTRNDSPIVVTPKEPPVSDPIDWTTIDQISIVRDNPVGTGAGAAVPQGALGIPVPVPDTALLDPDQVIMSTADRAALVEWDGLIGGGGDPGPLVISGDIPEELPGIDDFIIVEIKPKLISSVAPEYPRFAEQAGIEGVVWIKALVSRTGTVLEAVVYRTSESDLLDEAALKVAGQYRYKPAIQNRNPVACWVTYRVDFTLDD